MIGRLQRAKQPVQHRRTPRHACLSLSVRRSCLGIAILLCTWVARPAAACVGDCKGVGTVDIDDLITGVNIALGAIPVSACPALANADDAVDIAQLIAAVRNALGACEATRFIDNLDGTITDRKTGLMWEKKVGIGAGIDFENLHAADNAYPWTGACLTGGDLCQPDETAAAACRQGGEGPLDGCARCASDGACAVGAVDGRTTIWAWLVQLNAQGFAGFSDWRIPTVAELESLVDHTTIFPAVADPFNGAECGPTCTDITAGECSCTAAEVYNQQLGPYWSATAFAEIVEWWFVSFGGGGANWGGNLGGLPWDAHVRAVRGGAAGSMHRFVDNGDGTVTDNQTGLMWEKKDSSGGVHDWDNTYTWAGLCSAATGAAVGGVLCQPTAAAAAACAKSAQRDRGPCDTACIAATGRTCDLDPCGTCHPDQGSCIGEPNESRGAITTIWDWLAQLNAANFAGHADWRLPTQAELETIIDYSATYPAVYGVLGWSSCQGACPNNCSCVAMSEWSATEADNCPSLAWIVDFSDGTTWNQDTPTTAGARAVRNLPSAVPQ